MENRTFTTNPVTGTTTEVTRTVEVTSVPATSNVTYVPTTTIVGTENVLPTTTVGSGLSGSGAGVAPAVAHEEKKGGFFSHLFHHGSHGTAGTAAGLSHTDPLVDQSERFIDNLSKHPKELSYYEQFVVQYNRGMRFTPQQARRLVEVLIKNSSARAGTVPYYSVYAMELLLKLAIADPMIHAELGAIEDSHFTGLGLGRYIGNDETKGLGMSFMYYLYRFLNRPNYESWVSTKKDTMWQQEFQNYVMSQQSADMNMFLEGISRRLPPLLPHAGFAGGVEQKFMQTSTVPMTTTSFVQAPIASTTVTEIVREVPVSTQTIGNTTTTTYRPAF